MMSFDHQNKLLRRHPTIATLIGFRYVVESNFSNRYIDIEATTSGDYFPQFSQEEKIWNASRICVSSLRRGHANLLCIVPILVYVLPLSEHVYRVYQAQYILDSIVCH